MPLTSEDWIRLRLLQFVVDRGGTLNEEETVLMDSGILRLDQHLGMLLAQGHVQRGAEGGTYQVTQEGRAELSRLLEQVRPADE